ncbi:Lrp/AsnC family transcriptional regulator [Streptomyces sp. A7024]|uniref:Lrp/AsnC family transcriptional regulator n=1 Tax=Streptomyces coryli TaxID=1128680 RepID=A0A6G4UAM4_9ACTN|nr:Lrp/AsnC family transcriptional regulator [Streptomyces coryli]NGN69052.1 Lrp/AsnC family transcriptional regulator [Streptomyces coryli]
MDRIDRRILRELQQNGRLSNAELAERVRLTPSPCLRRVRQLERDEVIRGYRALLDGAAVDRGFQVFVTVVLAREDRATVAAFEDIVASRPEVVEAHRLFGEPDFLLRVAVRDLPAYERFHSEVLADLPGLGQLTSHMSMKLIKEDQGFPLDG